MGTQREFRFRARGGKRRGAGRKPNGPRAGVRHAARPELSERHPVLVTIRMAPDVPSLRHEIPVAVVRRVLREAKERLGVRVVHYSVQTNHVHLIVETSGKASLSQAMKGLGVRAGPASE